MTEVVPALPREAGDRAADSHGDGTGSRGSRRLDAIVVIHAGLFVVFAAWAYGGNTDWARTALAVWGSVGVILTAVMLITNGPHRLCHWQTIRLLWPLALFDVLVLASLFNPSFRAIVDGESIWFAQDPNLPRWNALPSTARADLSLRALWFFNVTYLSGFNLLFVRRRRILRTLLVILATNALALAVFGTVQKLMGATDLFFAPTKNVQPHFFASFIYHNHWGAFTVMMTATTLALVFHFIRRRSLRDAVRSPALLGIVSTVFLATTVPLSASRSSTMLMLVLLGGAMVFGLRRQGPRTGPRHPASIRAVVIVILGLLIAGSFIYSLTRPVISQRIAHTREQIAHARAKGEFMPNQTLYRDTWRLAREKPWFGWGMASYPTAFYHFNSQHYSSNGPNRLFHDAHSDWLQSIAEVGFVGTLLVVLCATVPLLACWRGAPRGSPLPVMLLAGCALVIVHGALEFPFGNGAVIVAFWTCFFGAIAYRRLDARTT